MSVNEHEMQIINKAFDDLISREAVCEIINDIRDCISVEGYWAILERLKKLPSVRQQVTVTEFADRCRECGARYGKLLKQVPKTGKWEEIVKEHKCYARDDTYTTTEYHCSECGAEPLAEYASDEADYALSNYCPNCGAKMEGEDKG